MVGVTICVHVCSCLHKSFFSVYEMEQRLNCPSKFMFPSFETTNWFAAARVIEQLRQSVRPAPFLVNGAKALLGELRRWASEAQQPGGQNRAEAIPAQVNVPLIAKVITIAKIVINSSDMSFTIV